MRSCQIRGGTAFFALCPTGQRAFFVRERRGNMLTTPMDVLTEFPVRKSKIQKLKFCNEIQRYMQNMGYSVTIESGSRNCRNIIIGDPQTAQYVVTAHYDTPPRMFLPNFITPCNPVIYTHPALRFLMTASETLKRQISNCQRK